MGNYYDHAKNKEVKNVEKLNLKSIDGIQDKEFLRVLDQVKESHEGCDLSINVVINQHQYE